MSYEDPTVWELCGVSYEATRKQANDIAVEVFATKEWVAYANAKDRVTYGVFSATSQEGQALVGDLVFAYRAAFLRTLEIARKHLGPEAC